MDLSLVLNVKNHHTKGYLDVLLYYNLLEVLEFYI